MQKLNLPGSHVHFIGIGGISMSGLAEILKKNGYTVSGSDNTPTEITAHLNKVGITVTIGNAYENITDDITVVVHTAAVGADNPEYQAAMDKNIPVMDRAALLGRIMDGYAYPVCIAGTHGKTTTTSMVADTLLTAGYDPTINLGGHMGDGFNFKIGESPYFVAEACEYAKQFLHWNPYIGVILNIDNDHMDVFGDMENLIASFAQFARNIKKDGALIIHSTVPGYAQIVEDLPCRVISFGGEGADFTYDNVQYGQDGKQSFDLIYKNKCIGHIQLNIPGTHNISNALACAAVAFTLHISPDDIGKGLQSAGGARRRYEHKGMYNGADIVDDYAHHPTEVRTFLSSVKKDREGMKSRGRILCLFQPHTYSRTRNLLIELSQSFDDADLVLILPIFASREKFDPMISSRQVVEKINEHGKKAIYFDSFDEVFEYIKKEVEPGDMLITMGAGDVYMVGERLLRT